MITLLRRLGYTISLLALACVNGCATIVSGTTQPIHLQAIDSRTHTIIPGAMCTLSDSRGHTYPSYSNPGTVVVTKGQGALVAHCHKPGYRQTQMGVGQSFNAWTIANVILFWPGVIVDAISGAIQSYPSHITVLMEASSRRY